MIEVETPPRLVTDSAEKRDIIYPDSDGNPMSDNTLQFEWITTIKGGLELQFKDDPLVFVAGDLLWYPVEGKNTIRVAPDAMVVFGRPKGYRGSYIQHREDGIAPQVVFEILSPGNTFSEMLRKWRFYNRHAVQEYYVYDPHNPLLEGWIRRGEDLDEILPENFTGETGWVSPLLGITIKFEADEMRLFHPDGRAFATYVELGSELEEQRARAEAEHQRAEAEHQRAERLAAKLRELGIDPD